MAEISRDPIEVTIVLPASMGSGWSLPEHELALVLPWYYRGLSVDQVRRVLTAPFGRNDSVDAAGVIYGGCQAIGTRDYRPRLIADMVRAIHAWATRAHAGRPANPMAAARRFLHPGHPTLSLSGFEMGRNRTDYAVSPEAWA